jgi:ATP/maltotriose-dependent transcriptional regulator MalT
VYVAQLWLSCSYPSLSPRGRPPLKAVETATPEGVAVHGPSLLAAALMQGVVDDATVAGAEQVLQTSRLSDITLGPLVAALATLIYAERLDRAEPWCDRLVEEAAARRSPTWQAVFAALRAEVAARQGDLPVAERQARAALTHMSPQSWGVAVGGPLATLVVATTAMGKYDEAERHLSQPTPKAMFQTPFGMHYLHARGRYHLATNRLHLAVADFTACGDLMDRGGMTHAGLVPWRTEAAQAYLQLGQTRRARALVDEQLRRLPPGHSRTYGITLRLLAATSELGQRPKLLGKAAAILERSGDRFELAQALADLGQTYRALGESNRARMTVRRAHELAKACGAEALCWTLHSGDLGLDMPLQVRPGPDGHPVLSDAERRVAALVIKGNTNREIARKLYITVSTVEQHLTRVYRKLRVQCRTDLPAVLAAVAEGDGLQDVERPCAS